MCPHFLLLQFYLLTVFMYLYLTYFIHLPSSYFSYLTHLFPPPFFPLWYCHFLISFLLGYCPSFILLYFFHLFSYLILFLLHFMLVYPSSFTSFWNNKHTPSPISWPFPRLIHRSCLFLYYEPFSLVGLLTCLENGGGRFLQIVINTTHIHMVLSPKSTPFKLESSKD